jgi:PAS domain-containing protein
MEKRLALLEPIVEALKHHEVDAVIGEKKIAFLLLPEVTEALRDSEAGFPRHVRAFRRRHVPGGCARVPLHKVNQKFCEMTGYSAEELLAKTYIGLTHPQDRKRDMGGCRACSAPSRRMVDREAVAFAKTGASSGWGSTGPLCATKPAEPSGSWP